MQIFNNMHDAVSFSHRILAEAEVGGTVTNAELPVIFNADGSVHEAAENGENVVAMLNDETADPLLQILPDLDIVPAAQVNSLNTVDAIPKAQGNYQNSTPEEVEGALGAFKAGEVAEGVDLSNTGIMNGTPDPSDIVQSMNDNVQDGINSLSNQASGDNGVGAIVALITGIVVSGLLLVFGYVYWEQIKSKICGWGAKTERMPVDDDGNLILHERDFGSSGGFRQVKRRLAHLINTGNNEVMQECEVDQECEAIDAQNEELSAESNMIAGAAIIIFCCAMLYVCRRFYRCKSLHQAERTSARMIIPQY